MDIKIQFNSNSINFEEVKAILKEVGMGYHDAKIHERAFENSHIVIFVFDGDKLIGFGRSISDGVYQSAFYDVAVLPLYQGKGIGKLIIDTLKKRSKGHTIILYATPGKEGFYIKNGFSKMKSGMGLFENEEIMRDRGFIE